MRMRAYAQLAIFKHRAWSHRVRRQCHNLPKSYQQGPFRRRNPPRPCIFVPHCLQIQSPRPGLPGFAFENRSASPEPALALAARNRAVAQPARTRPGRPTYPCPGRPHSRAHAASAATAPPPAPASASWPARDRTPQVVESKQQRDPSAKGSSWRRQQCNARAFPAKPGSSS